MAYELDSQMREGLRRQYSAMSDGELLQLAARPNDLTDMAQEVLRAEMQSRRLEAKQAVPLPDPFGLPRANLMPKPEFGKAIEKGKVALITLYDAIEAGQACDALEEDGVEIEMRDLSQTQGRGSFYGGSPIALQLIVSERDRERAVGVLREKMRLFPLEEIAEPDAMVDDGTVSTVGQFARRADAEDVARVLDEAKIWNRISANAEGSAETEDAFLVEVREIDLVQAGEMVEKALGLPEG
jgi:hypothetical protein